MAARASATDDSVVVPSGFAEDLIVLRRHLHRHPELSGQEENTAACVEAELRSLGLHPRRTAGTGVIADIAGQLDGPLVALRADLDALPITEATHLPFASENPGVMHACGHDGHTTMLVGAARLLTGQPRPPTLPVRLLFQPAEETNTGARQMVHAGALEGVAAVFGGHLDQKYDVGTIVVHHGSVNASTDTFTITVEGKGGHGARPHQGVDGILVGSEIVVALQTCLSREVNGGDAAVLTVGSFQAGDGAANVMAGRATLAGTFRALDVDVRMQMRRIVERVASSIAGMHGATVSVAWSHGVGPVVNTEREYDIARAAAMAVVGPTGTIALPSPNMGSEDFAAYMEAGWPGCYVRHGTATPGCSEVPAHSDTWDLNEDTLAVGAMYYARLANEAGERLAAAGATAVCGSLDEEKVL